VRYLNEQTKAIRDDPDSYSQMADFQRLEAKAKAIEQGQDQNEDVSAILGDEQPEWSRFGPDELDETEYVHNAPSIEVEEEEEEQPAPSTENSDASEEEEEEAQPSSDDDEEISQPKTVLRQEDVDEEVANEMAMEGLDLELD